MFLEYFLLALMGLLGVAGHILIKWYKWKGEGEWVWFSKTHLKRIVFGAFVVAVFLLLKDEIGEFYPLTKTTMFMLGFSTDVAFKNFTDKVSKKAGI